LERAAPSGVLSPETKRTPFKERRSRTGLGVWLVLAVWVAAPGRADAVLVEVAGQDPATGGLVLVAGDLEAPTVAAPDSSLRPAVLTIILSGRTDPAQPYGPLFADLTLWQQSAGLMGAASGVTDDAAVSVTGDAAVSESSAGAGGAANAAGGMGMSGTLQGVIGTPSSGTIEGTIGSTATVTLQGIVEDPSPVPLPPGAGLFAVGAAAWAGWRRWMRGLKTG
jgi:hypothetical protein